MLKGNAGALYVHKTLPFSYVIQNLYIMKVYYLAKLIQLGVVCLKICRLVDLVTILILLIISNNAVIIAQLENIYF